MCPSFKEDFQISLSRSQAPSIVLLLSKRSWAKMEAFWKVRTSTENTLRAEKDLMYLLFLLASLKHTFRVQAIFS